MRFINVMRGLSEGLKSYVNRKLIPVFARVSKSKNINFVTVHEEKRSIYERLVSIGKLSPQEASIITG